MGSPTSTIRPVVFAAATSPAIPHLPGMVPIALYAATWAGATATFTLVVPGDTYVGAVDAVGAATVEGTFTLTDGKWLLIEGDLRAILGAAPSWKIVSASAEAMTAYILYKPAESSGA